MPRKRASWGSNEPAARKGYRRLRFKADIGDGRGYMRHSKTIKGTRRDGDSELARLRVMYEQQREEGPRPTLRQCWEQWYEPELVERLEASTIRRRTVAIYRNQWVNHVEPRWGDTLFTDVHPDEYQKWLLERQNNQMARLANVLVGNLVQCAVKHGVKGIEFKKVRYRLPADSKERRERNAMVYSLEQISALVESLKGTIMEVPAILCGLGSCRVGEACAPTLEDVADVEVRGMRVALVRIDKQLSERGRKMEPVKNEDSVRTITIAEPWSLRILEIAEGNRSAGLSYLNDNGLCEPVGRAIISKRWKEFFDKGNTKLPYLPMQKLRNSWQTYMRWELGVDGDKIDRMMGHAGTDVRAKYYDRPDEMLFAETVVDAFQKFRSR